VPHSSCLLKTHIRGVLKRHQPTTLLPGTAIPAEPYIAPPSKMLMCIVPPSASAPHRAARTRGAPRFAPRPSAGRGYEAQGSLLEGSSLSGKACPGGLVTSWFRRETTRSLFTPNQLRQLLARLRRLALEFQTGIVRRPSNHLEVQRVRPFDC